MCHIKNLNFGIQNVEYADTSSFDNWFENSTDYESNNSFDNFLQEFEQQSKMSTTTGYDSSNSFDGFLQLPACKEEAQIPVYGTIFTNSKPEIASRKRERNEVDDITNKRKKQNEAARKCRQKKQDLLAETQDKVQQLEKEKFDMAIRLAILEKEKQSWLDREVEMQKTVKFLKNQLDQSHMIMMGRK